MFSRSARAGLTAAAALVAVLVAAGCSASSSSSSSFAPAGASSSPAAGAPVTASPSSSGSTLLSVGDFDSSFSAMARLKPLAGQGKGSIAVILPGTGTASRSAQFDAPYLTQSFASAGLSTVVADNGAPAAQLCAGQYASACTAAGIPG